MSRISTEIYRSGFFVVCTAYATIVLVNVATLILNQGSILNWLEDRTWGILVSFTVFDSWWTICGIVGLLVFFATILIGTISSQRFSLSIYFVICSIGLGVVSQELWNTFYNHAGSIPSGSSSIALAGLGMVFTFSLFCIARLWRQNYKRYGPLSRSIWYYLLIVYASIIFSTVWYIAYGQPIFVPVKGYNWRVHEIAFIGAALISTLYGLISAKKQNFYRNVVLDEDLMNCRFADFNEEKFYNRLPIYQIIFMLLKGGETMECHPEIKQIWVAEHLRGLDYDSVSQVFDTTLLHEMVHAELHRRNEDWQHGLPNIRDDFNAVALEVGTYPEK